MRNIEYKAELRGLALARGICATIGATRIGELRQTDTYYRVPDGRLKRRECSGEPVEYILYRRPDASGLKPSDFEILTEQEFHTRFGVRPLPVRVVVIKARELWIRSNVRIHLDRVEGLGEFFELEAMVSVGQPEDACRNAVAELRQIFAPALGEPISAGYADLLDPP
jgi:adenylate cyclase class IV